MTGHNCVTKVFSHELVEACTNPDVDTSNDSILVQGKNADGTAVTNDEIGDTCNNEFATVDMNGVSCSVQSYWSKADNACILPLGRTSFWVDKDTFGHDEVADVIATSGGTFERAFWVVVDGFSKDSFSALNAGVPVPTGSFAGLNGVTISQHPQIDYESGVPSDAQQRIRVGFDVTFTSAALGDFPTFGSQTYTLNAFLATDANQVPASDATALFELVAGADPYFTNIDPSQGNVFYFARIYGSSPPLRKRPDTGARRPDLCLRQCRRCFRVRAGAADLAEHELQQPVGRGPVRNAAARAVRSTQWRLVGSPLSIDFHRPSTSSSRELNFAVAPREAPRVAGPAGRLTTSCVSSACGLRRPPTRDYQTGSTYPSTLDAAGSPRSRSSGVESTTNTPPFFASGRLRRNPPDYGPSGVRHA